MTEPSAATAKKPQDGQLDDLALWGLVTAIFCPIVGFVCGAILASKGAATRGVLIMVGSVAATIFWSVVLVPELVGDDASDVPPADDSSYNFDY